MRLSKVGKPLLRPYGFAERWAPRISSDQPREASSVWMDMSLFQAEKMAMWDLDRAGFLASKQTVSEYSKRRASTVRQTSMVPNHQGRPD